MLWALVGVGYLSGSIPFGVLVASRVAGKKLGALVLLLDALKGTGPVLLGLHFAPTEPWLHVAIAAAAFLGHVFPVWLRFKGGKGVATALGVLLVLLPVSAAIGFVTWLVVLATTRISSVGSLLGALLAIGSSFVLGSPLPYSLLGVGLFLAMLWTHRGNLERILKRKENTL
jgi:glycerol-3-phosphate acyltransferase PlsY